MIRLYIIDDHILIIKGFYSSFCHESDGIVVAGGSLTVSHALQHIEPDKVDLIILDLFIRLLNPILNIQQIRKTFPSIPVVILSNESCLIWQVEMFRHGAKAYINKETDLNEMKQILVRCGRGRNNHPIPCLRYLLFRKFRSIKQPIVSRISWDHQ